MLFPMGGGDGGCLGTFAPPDLCQSCRFAPEANKWIRNSKGDKLMVLRLSQSRG